MRTTAFLVATAVLSVLAVLRVGDWALADEPAELRRPAPSTTSTTVVGTFLDGPLVRPTTTTTAAPSDVPVPAARGIWDDLARCESRNRWDAVRGVYQGGLQFDAGTWDHERAVDPALPADAQLATREQQIAVAERVLATQGARAWPTCGPRVGLVGGPMTGPMLPVAGPPDEIDDDE